MKQNLKYIICSVVFLFIGVITTILTLNHFKVFDNNKTEEVKKVSITEEDTIKTAVNKVKDAVVVIETYDNFNNKVGTGTGFIYKIDDKYGYIITNHHVISNSSSIMVTNSNGEELKSNLLGSDEYSDIAILIINKEAALKKVEFGDSTKAELGDTIFTVGSPLGKKYLGTVTKGILSGKDRQVEVSLTNGNFIMEVLQIDAAINPGNSGGPLLNINGEVIGVTSMKLVEDEIEGMGFAIPIELVTAILSDLEQGKTIERPLFGAQLFDADKAYYLHNYNINIDKEITEGTIIVKLENNSPAYNSELQAGDVITKIYDKKVENTAHFRYLLYKHHIGDRIKVTYNRDGKEKETEILLNKKL